MFGFINLHKSESTERINAILKDLPVDQCITSYALVWKCCCILIFGNLAGT